MKRWKEISYNRYSPKSQTERMRYETNQYEIDIEKIWYDRCDDNWNEKWKNSEDM